MSVTLLVGLPPYLNKVNTRIYPVLYDIYFSFQMNCDKHEKSVCKSACVRSPNAPGKLPLQPVKSRKMKVREPYNTADKCDEQRKWGLTAQL